MPDDLMGGKTPEEIAAAEKAAADEKYKGMSDEERAAAEKAEADKKAADDEKYKGMSDEERAAAEKAEADKAAEEKAANEKVDFTKMLTEAGTEPELVEIFKDLDGTLSKEQADALLKAGKLMKERETAKQEEYWKSVVDGWEKELEQDKEFGGERLEENANRVNVLLTKMKTGPALVEYLKQTQHQNCAPLFRFLAEVSTNFDEDYFVGSGDGGGKDKPAWAKMGYKSVDEY